MYINDKLCRFDHRNFFTFVPYKGFAGMAAWGVSIGQDTMKSRLQTGIIMLSCIIAFVKLI